MFLCFFLLEFDGLFVGESTTKRASAPMCRASMAIVGSELLQGTSDPTYKYP